MSTEQYLFELVRKNPNKITILCDGGDVKQLERLNRYANVQIYKKGTKYHCKRAFFNINLDVIEDVIAEDGKYYYITHSIFLDFNHKFPTHPKLTDVICPSKFAEQEYKKYGHGLPTHVVYNPLTIDPPERVVQCITACRLDDPIKGGKRTVELVKALDKWSDKLGIPYILYVFSNPVRKQIISKSITYVPRRIDVRNFISNCDWLFQLSDDMETFCYSIWEATALGLDVVSTDLSVLHEFPIPKEHFVTLDWDCENVDDIAREILTRKRIKYSFLPPQGSWDEILNQTEQEHIKMKIYNVKSTINALKGGGLYIPEFNGIPYLGQEARMTEARVNELTAHGYGPLIEIVGEVVEEVPMKLGLPGEIAETKTKKTKKKK